eukprot:scaffold139487_cov29-Prasinocladus_malaysianus.AAC.1
MTIAQVVLIGLDIGKSDGHNRSKHLVQSQLPSGLSVTGIIPEQGELLLAAMGHTVDVSTTAAFVLANKSRSLLHVASYGLEGA